MKGLAGVHKIAALNETFAFPNGKNASSEFRNVTYFNGSEEDRGLDNIHPLTHITSKLYGTKVDGKSKSYAKDSVKNYTIINLQNVVNSFVRLIMIRIRLMLKKHIPMLQCYALCKLTV